MTSEWIGGGMGRDVVIHRGVQLNNIIVHFKTKLFLSQKEHKVHATELFLLIALDFLLVVPSSLHMDC